MDPGYNNARLETEMADKITTALSAPSTETAPAFAGTGFGRIRTSPNEIGHQILFLPTRRRTEAYAIRMDGTANPKESRRREKTEKRRLL